MKIKKLLVLVSMLAVMFSLAGCDEKYDKPFDYNEQEIALNAMQSFVKYENIYDEYVDYYIESGTEFEQSAVKGIKQAQETDKVGEFENFSSLVSKIYTGEISLEDANVKIENGPDYVTVVLINNAANRDVEVRVKYVENPDYYLYLSVLLPQEGIASYDMFLKNIESMASEQGLTVEDLCAQFEIVDLEQYYFDNLAVETDVITNLKSQGIYPYIPEEMVVAAVYSTKELMGQAGLNTIIGMGTVFIVLIFISFVISLFKYLPALFAKKPKLELEKKAAPAKASATNKNANDAELAAVIAAAAKASAEDDSQLIAVITAAIHEYEAQSGNGGISKDKLVVRSIRKVRK